MKTFIWISFDLGVTGDYEGMYTWLDGHKARECGGNVACLHYEHSGDLLAGLAADIKKHVKLNGRGRVYVIHLRDGKMKGTFVAGNRRDAPWTGYANQLEEVEDTA